MADELNTVSMVTEPENSLADFLRQLQPLLKRADVEAPSEDFFANLTDVFLGTGEKSQWAEQSDTFAPMLQQLQALNEKLEAGHALTQEEKTSLAELHTRLENMKRNAEVTSVFNRGAAVEDEIKNDIKAHAALIDDMLAVSTTMQNRLTTQAGQAIAELDIGTLNADGSITTSSTNEETGVVTSGRDSIFTQAEMDRVIGESKNGIAWDENTRAENAANRAAMRASVDRNGDGVASDAEIQRAISNSGLQMPDADMLKAIARALNPGVANTNIAEPSPDRLKGWDPKPSDPPEQEKQDPNAPKTDGEREDTQNGEQSGTNQATANKGRTLGAETVKEKGQEKDPLEDLKRSLEVVFKDLSRLQDPSITEGDLDKKWDSVKGNFTNAAMIRTEIDRTASLIQAQVQQQHSKDHAATLEKAAFGASLAPLMGNFAPLLKLPGMAAEIMEAGKRMFGTPVAGVGEAGETVIQFISPLRDGPAPAQQLPQGTYGLGGPENPNAPPAGGFGRR